MRTLYFKDTEFISIAQPHFCVDETAAITFIFIYDFVTQQRSKRVLRERYQRDRVCTLKPTGEHHFPKGDLDAAN